MKKLELMSKLGNIGYTVKDCNSGEELYIYSDGFLIARVSNKVTGKVDTMYTLDRIGEYAGAEMLKSVIEYALTPLDEREGTKKYLVQLLPTDEGYLNLNKDTGGLEMDSCVEVGSFQTRFTEEEYGKLQKEYSQWLPKFDKNDQRFEEVVR